ncbi:MAG TPA: hypothetical protein VKV28_16505 [Candidatus Binataceae bacterium]|nr:hypothetical protein [Candidatus Binataceae bacterium]
MASGKWRMGAVVALSLTLVAPWCQAQSNGTPTEASSAQVPQPANGGVDWKGVGIGAATLLANVGYIPAKAVYAILGGLGGGAGYALTGGNTQTADTIWRSALGGDYVLTPAMISGQTPIHFSGPTMTPPDPNAVAASPPASSAGAAPAGVAATPPASQALNSAPSPSLSGLGSTHITTVPGDAGAGPVH